MSVLNRGLVVVCLVVLSVKLAFVTRLNMVTGDESIYTLPAKNIVESGRPIIQEYKDICHFDKNYYFAGTLFLYIQAAFYSLFGYTFFIVKLVPFVMYLLSGFFLYLLTKRLIDSKIAFLTLIFWYLLPSFMYRVIARPEATQLCLMLASIWILFLIKDNPTFFKLLLCGFIAGASLWIHPTTCFVSVVPIFALSLFYLPFKQFLTICAGQLLMLLFYLITFFIPNYQYFQEQFYEAGLVWMDNELLTTGSVFEYRFWREIEKLQNFFGRQYVAPFSALLICSVVYGIYKNPKLYLKFFVAVVPGALIASFMSAHSAASFFYYVYLLPFLVMMIAYAIGSIERDLIRIISVSLIVIYFVAAQGVVLYKRKDTDFKKLADLVASKIEKDAVVIGPETYNMDWNSSSFLGITYYTFWVSIQKKGDLLTKYESVYGNSFLDFLKRRKVGYVILDRNNQDSFKLERDITEKYHVAEKVDFIDSEYGMWETSQVRIYKITH